MNLIAIETSTENCSVALLHNGTTSHREQVAPQKHAELVLGYLDELLNEAGLNKSQIDGIVFGQGPGAFTGVRIAMSIVQGLALAWDTPVLAISTLHNMAYQVAQDGLDKHQKIMVANDARMGEVYWATFTNNNGQVERLSADALAAPEEIDTQGYVVCSGSAFKTMIEANNEAIVLPDALPSAKTLITMAQTDFNDRAMSINDIAPTYIREKVVFT